MTRLRALGYIISIISLTLGLLSLSGGGSQAALLSETETPSLIPIDTPTATLTGTPTATATGTPTATATGTPTTVAPTLNPAPDVSPTTPTGSLPPDTTPMGTFTLPQSGQSNPLPVSLLLVVAGGLLGLWAWLLKQSSHHS